MSFVMPVTESGCWIWMSTVYKRKGQLPYGRMWIASSKYKHYGRLVNAHRVSWELFKGPIPDDLCVCHKCDVPSCVNPEHLFLGTHKENSQDMVKKNRGKILRGSAVKTAKLTKEDIKSILSDQRMQKDIAADYGVHQVTISKIKLGKLWRNI